MNFDCFDELEHRELWDFEVDVVLELVPLTLQQSEASFGHLIAVTKTVAV